MITTYKKANQKINKELIPIRLRAITLQGRRGIEPKTELNPFLKTVFNFFCMHKTDFFVLIFFP